MFKRAAILCLLIVSAVAAAGPRVEIVLDRKAEELERLAANELSTQLAKLFDADVKIVTDASRSAPYVIHVGRQDGLSKQGIVLRSERLQNRQQLRIAGGSPVATLWAVYEYGHRTGVRYFLFGDLYPVTPPKFTLEDFDVSLTCSDDVRSFSLNDASLLGARTWSIDEQQQVLRQLAKLRINQVVIANGSGPPAVSIRVDGDTAGRSAFRGAKVLEIPASLDRQELHRSARESGIAVIEGASAKIGVLPRMLSDAVIGDLDLTAHYVSRTAWGIKLTPEQACHDLVTPVCGDEVSTRVWKAMELCQKASNLIAENDPALDFPQADMLLKHHRNEPPPAWWTEARDHYLNAMNEMYRANTRAREGGRVYTLYHARRFEFAFQYINCLIAIRKAGVAKAQSNEDARLTELETAVEAIYSSLNALAAVARSSTDRATIALLNEYGYRPLKRELEAAGQ